MTEDERKEKGLVKELKYRYAFASGDFNFLGEKENTNYLRALAHLGVRLDDGENDKYFTPESIAEIKKKKKDSNYNTTLINPIYISDFQAPLEDYEIITTGGEALYEVDQLTGERVFIGNEPIVETKNVKRPAERRITPADVQLGLEGAGGTADTTIPPEGTDNTIKKLEVSFGVSAELTSQNTYALGVSIVTNPDGTFNKSKSITEEDFGKVTFTKFNFDPFGYIIVDGIKYSALQVINTSDSKTALQLLRELDKDEYDRIIDSWGFSDTTVETPARTDGETEREAPEAEEGDEQQENRTTDELSTTTANSSILEKINLFRGWVVKDGQVQKDKNGNPKTNGDKTPQLRISDTAEVTIDSNGSVSIKGDVTINISNKSDKVKLIENGKFTVPFGTIDGNFLCRKVGLTSLTGCPKVVKGTFDCSENSITTLAGSPDEVGIFIATGNKSLTNLSGSPKKILGITTPSKSQNEYIYDVSSCALTSLDGNGIISFGPGGFNCANNKITSLSGLGVISTTGVTKFNCSKNLLTSLVGAPKTIKDTKTGKPGEYNISNNTDITTFPQTMADIEVGEFRASGLSLSSLSFAPKQVYGNFDCSGNAGKKLTNQSIGKDRFKVGGGFEEDAGNRIVKIDGDFITSEGSWKDKTYDINTVFKAGQSVQSDAGSRAPSTSGSVGGVEFISKEGKKEKIWLQKFNPNTLVGGYSPPKASGTNSAGKTKYEFTRRTPSAWVSAGYKNFINAGPFEDGTNPTWGAGSPNGLFIVNGNNYGSKVDGGSTDIHPKNSDMRFCPLVVISPFKDIVAGKYDVKAEKGGVSLIEKQGLGNIKIAIPMYNICIQNNQVKSTHESFSKYASWPFIGILGSGAWFAGAASIVGNSRTVTDSWNIPEISREVLDFWNKKGDTVKKMAGGDGGGSTKLVINGQTVAGHSEQRPVSTILAW